MRARALVAFCLLLAGVPFGCTREEIRLAPSALEAARLDAHVETIFADVRVESAAELEADRVRVEHAHRLAYLVEAYRAAAGHYPLAVPDSLVFRQTLIGELHDRKRLARNLGETWVEPEAFAEALRAVLGPGVEVPGDPLPDAQGTRAYAYGVYGTGYTLAVMLYHPAGWSEGIAPHQWQYRLGSEENLDLPVLATRKLLEGGYPGNRVARARDAAVAGF
jgi:hypothetical protein